MTEDLTVLLHLDLVVRTVEQGSYEQIRTSKNIDTLHIGNSFPHSGGGES